MAASYPRVMVVNGAALGSMSAGGLTLSNLFFGWPANNIAQAYIVGLMAYKMGGIIWVFFSLTSFAVLIMAIVARLADQALAAPRANTASVRPPPRVVAGRRTTK